MSNPFYGGGGSNSFYGGGGSNPFYGTSASPKTAPHHASGVGGFVGHLGSDIVHTVAGIPTGVVHLVEHPVGSVKQMAKGTWQTWSPLFHGQFGKFGHNLYDHPLAPILDVASLLSLGVGSAARAGELLSGAGAAGRAAALAGEDVNLARLAAASKLAEKGGFQGVLGKAARLKVPKEIQLIDPKALEGSMKLRPEVPFRYSTRPLKRLTQEHVLPALFHKLPEGTQSALRNTRYEQKLYGYMAHRATAKTAVLGSVFKAADLLHGATREAYRARLKVATHMWGNLYRNGKIMSHEDAVNYLLTHNHELPVRDPRTLSGMFAPMVNKARAKEAAAVRTVERHTARANAVPALEAHLSKSTDAAERRMLQRQIRNGKKSATALENYNNKLARATEARQRVEQHSFTAHFEQAAQSPEHLKRYGQSFGPRGVVSIRGNRTRAKVEAALTKAYHDGSGNVSLVPKHDAATLGHELGNSVGMMGKILGRPTMLWKTIQVRWTPRTLTNNGVGNMLLYVLRHDPASAAFGLYHATKILHGARKAGEDFMKSMPGSNSHWFWRHFAPELSNVFGADALNTTGKLRLAKSGFYPLVHKLADEPIRAASIVNAVHASPEVRALMKSRGLSFDEAASRALAGKSGRALERSAIDHARSVAGDYQAMTGLESKIRNVAPFYMWDRHALRSTKAIVTETPGKAAALTALGQEGRGINQQLLGQVPQYLEGALPLSLLGLGDGGGRSNIVTTTSLNPFSTVGDVAQLAQALTVGHTVNPGNALLSQVNPFVTGAMSWAAGKNIETGAPQPSHGGVITSDIASLAQNFPEYKTVEGLMNPAQTTTAKGNPKVLTSDQLSAISSFLGVPIRRMSKSAAQAAAVAEQTGKYPRKKKSVFY